MLKRPEKTFFPKHWDYFKIMESVMEALGNAKVIRSTNSGFYLVEGLTNGGMKIRAYVDRVGTVASWYPYLN